ncbi:hypothetical protein MNBD_GAMMA07-1769 [hydrothermal vent metagenome]|uniref:Cytochrome c domain-containing protein n=1 Tax=hydrothermal vent metagenome TaxID=652676 RepID=A0A3B0WQQ9_9ZZZZ
MKQSIKNKLFIHVISLLGLGLLLCSPLVFSSGAFSPSGGGNSNAEYSIGKAIYAGRLGSSKCSGCHKRFKRSRLMKLNKSPVDIAMDCKKHTPCFKGFIDADQKSALLSYFIKRYRL